MSISMLDDEFPAILEREAGMPPQVNEVAVAFGLHYERDAEKSLDAGHEVFRDVVFVKIAVPGDKNSLFFQPATDKHKERFPVAWANFNARSKGEEGSTGMPIEQWAPITRGMAMTLKAMHIHTVEALANVHDGHIEKIGLDARALRAKAQAFLAQAADSATTTRLAAEKQDLKDQLEAMRNMIAALQSQGAVTPSAAPAPLGDSALVEENQQLRSQFDTLSGQVAQILANQTGAQPQTAEIPTADNPEAARKPRGFQKKA